MSLSPYLFYPLIFSARSSFPSKRIMRSEQEERAEKIRGIEKIRDKDIITTYPLEYPSSPIAKPADALRAGPFLGNGCEQN